MHEICAYKWCPLSTDPGSAVLFHRHGSACLSANVQTHQTSTSVQVAPTIYLSSDQGEAVGGQDLINGLEVGRAAAGAVTGASRGDTLGLGTGVEGSARVAGLGAHVGLGKTGDTALGVVDGRAQGADRAAVDTGGRAGAADAGSGGGRGAARDGQGAGAVAVDVAPEGGPADSADVAHVGAAWEDRGGEGSKRRTAHGGAGGDRSTGAAAVAGRDEASRDGEADGAPRAVGDDVGVAALDRGDGGWHRLNGLHRELGRLEADLRGQRLGVGGAVGERLDDELVGGNIDVVRRDARVGRGRVAGLELADVQVVKGQLGVLKLVEAVGHYRHGGAGSGHLVGQGCVSDTDVDRGAVLGDPSAGERGTSRGAQLLDDIGGSDLPGDTSSGLLSVQPQVALHGGQDLRVKLVCGRRGGTVGKGQDGCQDGEVLGELHV